MNKTYFMLIFLVLLLMIVSGCNNKYNDASTYEEIPTLNLTKHSLWDNPVFKENDKQKFNEQMLQGFSPEIKAFYNRMKKGEVSVDELQNKYDSLATSKMEYAGYLRLTILNDILINTPLEKFTKEFVMYCIDQAYTIAEGNAPVPQSMFFNFWDNCMVGLSNLGAYQEISDEAQKMLEICERQNLPMGLMFSYRALAGNLQDHSDYSTAMEEYEKADNMARQCFPELISPTWSTPDDMKKNMKSSDLVMCYVDIKSNQLYCSVKSKNYEWVKKNEKYLNQIIDGTEGQPTVQLFMLYNMAQYYDSEGNDSLFNMFISRAAMFKPNSDVSQATYIDMEAVSWNNYTMALHELRHGHPKEALTFMNNIPKDWITIQDNEIYAEIFMQLGLYQEAAERLFTVVEHDKGDLDGRNRSTITSMSANIENKKHEIQMMQVKIDHQKTQLIYNWIIMILAFILISVLIFFLRRQSKLNQRLAVALDKAEAAIKAKNIFLKNMTHEIHTPINQIYGFAQIMADRSIPFEESSMREMCDYICESSEHLTKVADNIIEVADKLSELDDLEEGESILK